MGNEPVEFVQRARLLLARRKVAEAVQVCRAGLIASPEVAEGHAVLGAALLALGRGEEALHAAREALALDERSGAAWAVRGEALAARAEYGGAERALLRALELEPHSDRTAQLLAETRTAIAAGLRDAGDAPQSSPRDGRPPATTATAATLRPPPEGPAGERSSTFRAADPVDDPDQTTAVRGAGDVGGARIAEPPELASAAVARGRDAPTGETTLPVPTVDLAAETSPTPRVALDDPRVAGATTGAARALAIDDDGPTLDDTGGVVGGSGGPAPVVDEDFGDGATLTDAGSSLLGSHLLEPAVAGVTSPRDAPRGDAAQHVKRGGSAGADERGVAAAAAGEGGAEGERDEHTTHDLALPPPRRHGATGEVTTDAGARPPVERAPRDVDRGGAAGTRRGAAPAPPARGPKETNVRAVLAGSGGHDVAASGSDSGSGSGSGSDEGQGAAPARGRRPEGSRGSPPAVLDASGRGPIDAPTEPGLPPERMAADAASSTARDVPRGDVREPAAVAAAAAGSGAAARAGTSVAGTGRGPTPPRRETASAPPRAWSEAAAGRSPVDATAPARPVAAPDLEELELDEEDAEAPSPSTLHAAGDAPRARAASNPPPGGARNVGDENAGDRTGRDTRDRHTRDRDTSHRDTSDRDTSDRDTSDRDTSDRDWIDSDWIDSDGSDRDTSDRDGMDSDRIDSDGSDRGGNDDEAPQEPAPRPVRRATDPTAPRLRSPPVARLARRRPGTAASGETSSVELLDDELEPLDGDDPPAPPPGAREGAASSRTSRGAGMAAAHADLDAPPRGDAGARDRPRPPGPREDDAPPRWRHDAGTTLPPRATGVTARARPGEPDLADDDARPLPSRDEVSGRPAAPRVDERRSPARRLTQPLPALGDPAPPVTLPRPAARVDARPPVGRALPARRHTLPPVVHLGPPSAPPAGAPRADEHAPTWPPPAAPSGRARPTASRDESQRAAGDASGARRAVSADVAGRPRRADPRDPDEISGVSLPSPSVLLGGHGGYRASPPAPRPVAAPPPSLHASPEEVARTTAYRREPPRDAARPPSDADPSDGMADGIADAGTEASPRGQRDPLAAHGASRARGAGASRVASGGAGSPPVEPTEVAVRVGRRPGTRREAAPPTVRVAPSPRDLDELPSGARAPIFDRRFLSLAVVGGAVVATLVAALTVGLLREWRLGVRVGRRTAAAETATAAGTWAGYQAAAEEYRRILLDRPTSDAARAARARVLSVLAFEFGEPADAALRAVSALGTDGSEDATAARAYLALARGDAGKARRVAAEMDQRFSDATARYVRGRAELLAGDADAAARSLAEAVGREPTDPLLLHGLGLAEAERRHDPAALDAFRRALERSPRHPATLLDRALLQMRRGRELPAAEQDLRRVVGEAQSDAAPAELARAYVALADIQLAAAHVVAARVLLGRAAAHRPEGNAPLAETLAVAHLRAFELDAAESEARRAVATAPARDAGHFILAKVALARHRPREALEHIAHANMTEPEALLVRGDAMLALGDGRGARAAVETALHLAPDDAALHAARAHLYLLDGSPQAALRELDRAERSRAAGDGTTEGGPASGGAGARTDATESVNQGSVGAARLAEETGRALLALGRPDRAREWFDRAIDRDPLALGARMELARLERADGRDAEARAQLDLVLESDERDFPAAHRELGAIALDAHDGAAARDQYDALLARSPADVDALLGAARARLLLGDPPAALGFLDRADRAGAGGEALTSLRARALLAADRAVEAWQLLRPVVGAAERAETARLFVVANGGAGHPLAPRALWRALPPRLRGAPEVVLARAADLVDGGAPERGETMALALLRQDRRRGRAGGGGLAPRLEAEGYLVVARALEARRGGGAPARRQALRYLEAAARLDPRNAVAACALGVALQSEGQGEAALQAVERAVAADPGFAEAQYQLGRLRLDAGGARARGPLLAYLRLAPRGRHAGEVRRLIAAGGIAGADASDAAASADAPPAPPPSPRSMPIVTALAPEPPPPPLPRLRRKRHPSRSHRAPVLPPP